MAFPRLPDRHALRRRLRAQAWGASGLLLGIVALALAHAAMR